MPLPQLTFGAIRPVAVEQDHSASASALVGWVISRLAAALRCNVAAVRASFKCGVDIVHNRQHWGDKALGLWLPCRKDIAPSLPMAVLCLQVRRHTTSLVRAGKETRMFRVSFDR